MRKILLLSAALTAVLASTVGAHASTYTFSISGSDTGSLTLVGTAAGLDAGSIHLTSGGGTLDGSTVFLVTAPTSAKLSSPFTDPTSGAQFDDEFYPSTAPYVDDAGLEFTDNAGLFFIVSGDANPANDSVITLTGKKLTANHFGHLTFSSPAVSATPEPSSMVLLGTGLLGLAGAVRRKFSINA